MSHRNWFLNAHQYVDASLVPEVFLREPNLGLARLYPNGKTQPGWGAKEFVSNLALRKFRVDRADQFYTQHGWPFGIIMRSVPFVCIDIDGKNGGIDMAQVLTLPPTLAETSRSGNGYHLFYKTHEDWNENLGYRAVNDIIGLVPGIDVKGTGLVYHYPHQRWNELEMADLPKDLENLLMRVTESKRISRVTRRGTDGMDPDDLAVVHDELKTELKSKFVPGSRNNKLFAIGAKMCAADFPHWDLALYERGIEIGLTEDEISGIITNIDKYT